MIPIVNTSYTRNRVKAIHSIDFSYSLGKIKSTVAPKADNKVLLLQYDFLFNLKPNSSNKKYTSYLGFGLHSLLSNTNYLPEVELSKSYLSGVAYLALSAKILYRLNKKSSIVVQIGLPVVGGVYRPDFDINGKALTKRLS